MMTKLFVSDDGYCVIFILLKILFFKVSDDIDMTGSFSGSPVDMRHSNTTYSV